MSEPKRDLKGTMFDIEDPILDAENCARGLSLMLSGGQRDGLDEDDICALMFLTHRAQDAVNEIKEHWEHAFRLVVKPGGQYR